MGMMNMLIKYYQMELNGFDSELEKMYEKIESMTTTKQYNNKEAELQKYLENLNRNIISNKEKKFNRDKKQFSENKAYRWNRTSGFQARKQNKYASHMDNRNDTNLDNGSMLPISDSNSSLSSSSSLQTSSSRGGNSFRQYN